MPDSVRDPGARRSGTRAVRLDGAAAAEFVADVEAAPWDEWRRRGAFLRWARGEGPDLLLCVDVWVYAGDAVLLVRHPVRGWVMPGGKAEAGEGPRAAAVRELAEETGVVVVCDALTPAGLGIGSSPGPDGTPLDHAYVSYAVTVAADVTLVGEPGRPAAWWPLGAGWASVFDHDAARLRRHAILLAGGAPDPAPPGPDLRSSPADGV
jgi:8-oxo-dGTP diphosphatase